jgi:hypothetical protein
MKPILVILSIAFAILGVFVLQCAIQQAWLSATPASDPEFYGRQASLLWRVTLALISASLVCVIMRLWIGRRQNP